MEYLKFDKKCYENDIKFKHIYNVFIYYTNQREKWDKIIIKI